MSHRLAAFLICTAWKFSLTPAVPTLICFFFTQSHSSVVESSKLVQTSPAPSLPLQERGLGNLALGQGAVEAALAKRISFGARILTQ